MRRVHGRPQHSTSHQRMHAHRTHRHAHAGRVFQAVSQPVQPAPMEAPRAVALAGVARPIDGAAADQFNQDLVRAIQDSVQTADQQQQEATVFEKELARALELSRRESATGDADPTDADLERAIWRSLETTVDQQEALAYERDMARALELSRRSSAPLDPVNGSVEELTAEEIQAIADDQQARILMDTLVKELEQEDLERAMQESLATQNESIAEPASAEDPIPVMPAPVQDAENRAPVSTGLLDRLRNLSPAWKIGIGIAVAAALAALALWRPARDRIVAGARWVATRTQQGAAALRAGAATAGQWIWTQLLALFNRVRAGLGL